MNKSFLRFAVVSWLIFSMSFGVPTNAQTDVELVNEDVASAASESESIEADSPPANDAVMPASDQEAPGMLEEIETELPMLERTADTLQDDLTVAPVANSEGEKEEILLQEIDLADVKEKIEELLPSLPPVLLPAPEVAPADTAPFLFTHSITGSSSPDFTAQEPVTFELGFDVAAGTIVIEPIHEKIPEIPQTIEEVRPAWPLEPLFLPTPSPAPTAVESLVLSFTSPIRAASRWIAGFFSTAHAAEPLSGVTSGGIRTVVRDWAHNIVKLPVHVENDDGQTLVRIPAPTHLLHPGQYTLEVTATVHGQEITVARDFTWGVVAMNLNKSSYLPHEPVHVGMAVLDDEGHTICDAQLTLTVTGPDGSIVTLQTQDSGIVTAPTCSEASVTDIPDYHTVYTPTAVGEHSLALTATSHNGTRQLNDAFTVTDETGFVLERAGATRIFPPSPYTMRLMVTSKQAIKARIQETVPAAFVVTDISEGGTVTRQTDRQTISWDVRLRADQAQELYYTYDAPDISPEFYLLGPVKIKGGNPELVEGLLWQDPRSWQIAADVIANGANAIDALGQYDNSLTAPLPIYTKNTAQNAPNRLGMNAPNAVLIDSANDRLFVSDGSNNRVLVYDLNANDTLIDRIPDNVLGQVNFSSNTASTTQSGMAGPDGLAYDSTNKRLFVATTTSHRVIVFDVTAITDGENAVNVLGQSNFTNGSANLTQAGLNAPNKLAFDSTNNRLFVSEGSNNRVVVYDVAAISNGENAANVLGQANFTTATAALTQAGLNVPRGVAFESTNNRLFIGDASNNRVIVYNVAVVSDGESAVNVLGQTDFTSGTGATSQAGLNDPRGVAIDSSNRVFVASATSDRVTIYDVAAISDGESAVSVLGQANFTDESPATTQAGMNAPVGTAFDSTNNYLYVADKDNARVVAYDVAAISNGESAADALGQYDNSLSAPGPIYTKGTIHDAPNRLGLSSVAGVVVDSANDRLFVADFSNNRVLVFGLNADDTLVDRIPDNVLGQANFYSNSAATTQLGMNSPTGMAYDSANKRLFVVQQTINRVTVYDVTAISDGENAVNVLGQANFTAATAATSQTGMNVPRGIAFDSTNNRLFVADGTNHRVVAYNMAVISDGESAVSVLGQTDFTSATAATSQTGMNAPRSVAFDSTNNRLFVPEESNNRVTVYDVAAISDGESAVNVLGQANFTAATAATSQTGMNAPRGVTYDASTSRLFVSDASNHRVTGYDVAAISDGENAVHVLGQATFTAAGGAASQTRINGPIHSAYDSTNKRLYVADSNNHRVAVYDVSPSISGTVYSDEGATPLASKTVAISVNGAAASATVTSDSLGRYTFNNFSMTADDVLTLYIDGASEDAVIVTKATGSELTNMDLYQNRLIVRCDDSCSLTNTNLDTADNNADGDITSTYAVSAGALTVSSGKELFIWASHTFAPGGAVTVDDIDINGTFTMSTHSAEVTGSWDATGGTFTGNNTVSFTSTGTETITSNGNSFTHVTFNGAGGLWNSQSAMDVDGVLTISNGTLDLNSFNLTNTGGSFVNNGTLQIQGSETITGFTADTDSGTVSYDGTGSYTTALSYGNTYYNLIFNGSGGVWEPNGAVTVNNNLTITAGTFDADGQNLTVTGTFSNDDTLRFTGGETSLAFTNDTNSGTIAYDGSASYSGLNAGDAYHHLTFNGAGTWALDAALDVNSNLTITAGTLNLNGFDVDASGNVSNAGTISNSSGRTITLSGTTQSFAPGAMTWGTVAITGSSGTVTAGSNFTVATLLQIAAGRTLAAGSSTITSNGTITNAGTITEASGVIIDHASSFFIADSNFEEEEATSLGVDSIYLTIFDEDSNKNGQSAETLTNVATVSCPNGSFTDDSQTVSLTETGNATGVFRSGSGIVAVVGDASVTANDGTLECQDDETITATFTDPQDGSDTESDTALATTDTIPAAPSGFAGTVNSSSSITWRWTDNATDENGFRLYSSSNTLLATIATANTTSYTETGLSGSTSYTRKVASFNDAGRSSFSNTATLTTPASPAAPTAPSLENPLDQANLTTLTPTFTFGRSSDINNDLSGYTLLFDAGQSNQESINLGNPAPGSVIQLAQAEVNADADTISVRITDADLLTADDEHSWKVRATDAAGNTTDSGTRTFTISLSSTTTATTTTTPASSSAAQPLPSGEESVPPALDGASPVTITLEQTDDTLAVHAPSIAEVIDQIARGEIPTRTPSQLQLEELAKHARLRRGQESDNLMAWLARLMPESWLDALNRALAYFINETRQLAFALLETGKHYLAVAFNISRTQALALRTLLDDDQDDARLIAASVVAARRDGALAQLSGFSRLLGQIIYLARNFMDGAEYVLLAARFNRLQLAAANEQYLNRVFEPARVTLQRTRVAARVAWESLGGRHDQPLVISDVTIEALEPTRVVLSWTTSRLTYGKINWGPTLSYGADGQGGEIHSSGLDTTHQVELTSVRPNSPVYFEVVATDTNSTSTADAYYFLVTPQ